ncbi:MAG: hypothetical protein HY806_07725 [Nitrospirae bacterium]|nr:hypothetical protein [Nitrospirota bacterium]
MPVFLLSFGVSDSLLAYADNNETEALIISSAESFFISLKERDFKAAWGLLSEKSRKTIMDEEYGILKGKINKDDLIKDFNRGGERFLYYWNTYVENFDPDLALKKAVWKMGEIKDDKAVIILHVQGDAELMMFKQDGRWRVGLVESFWTRK